jgi:hypothetical protein
LTVTDFSVPDLASTTTGELGRTPLAPSAGVTERSAGTTGALLELEEDEDEGLPATFPVD